MGRRTIVAAAVAAAALACGGGTELRLPTAAELEGLYGPRAEVTLNGNVVDVRVAQDAADLRRGGDLWARVGPYIYLFSPQTRDIFRTYGGVGGVRVVTITQGSRRVAEAMLVRDTLTSVTWQEAIRHVARARREGTDNPGHLEDLVRFGEDWARYEYEPRYAPTP